VTNINSLSLALALLSACGGGPLNTAPDATTGTTSSQPACTWPTPVDAGPGACRVKRAYLECDYPTGGTCDDGSGFGPRATMLCLSDNPSTCSGCHPTTGTTTCRSMCAPGQYAMECGGTPKFTLEDGGIGLNQSCYEQAPDVCNLARLRPSSVAYLCCPCL
jgi:hypothetical protein